MGESAEGPIGLPRTGEAAPKGDAQPLLHAGLAAAAPPLLLGTGRTRMTAVSPVEGTTGGAPLCPPPEAAFANFYNEHSNRGFAYCLKRLRSREEAEDAAQTTFLYAWRGLGRGVVPGFESAWLLTIARNVCLNRAEAAGRRAVEVARDPCVLEDTVPAPVPSDELEGLPEALAALTEQQRRAIVMREWQGLTYREIALALGLTQSAVETLLFRARRTLAAGLRSPVGIGSLLPWCRSPLAGGGAKLVIGAAVVAVTTAGSVATIAHEARTVPTKTRATARAPAVAHRAVDKRVFRAVKRSGAAGAAARNERKHAIATVGNVPSTSQPDVAHPPDTVRAAPPAAQASAPDPDAEQIVASAASTVAAASEPPPSVIDTATSTTGVALDAVSSAVDTATSTVDSVEPPQLPDVPVVTVTATDPSASLGLGR
jgi:RNA polymerase sigma factor (sigma-70 family)